MPPDGFVGLLPSALRGALFQHHSWATALMHKLGDETSRAADDAKQQLTALQLPQAPAAAAHLRPPRRPHCDAMRARRHAPATCRRHT